MCVNGTLDEGAMFDYVARAEKDLGGNCVVLDPNVSETRGCAVEGSETSQNHVCSAYGQVVRPGDDKRPVVIVAHSYGAAAVSYLFKARPEARAEVRAEGGFNVAASRPTLTQVRVRVRVRVR